ncbi:neuroendocrine convertase 1-like [Asterias amurensis]|uniref:neuroendocrine convertase 1-like n=1 Tax=Asterias amurensis TaxID=7602 RepID=UPI003AB870E5
MRIFHHGVCHVLLLFTLMTCSCAADDHGTLHDDDNDDDNASYFTNEFAVLVKGGMDVVREVAHEHGYQLKIKIGSLPDYYILHHEEIPVRSRRGTDNYHTKKLGDDHRVEWFQQQEAKTRTKRDAEERTNIPLDFNDPLYNEEWYLNVGDDTEREVPHDMRIKEVWEQGITGVGVVVAIVDDGLEIDHTDLARNYDPQASWNFKENRQDPTPPAFSLENNGHGTRCAGEVSMVANNSKCGVGIAFDAKIGGIRIIDGKVTDAIEGAALSYNVSHVDIYSASWGPSDNGKTAEVPGPLAQAALEQGIREGRDGKGALYSWASGNGGKRDDCNCDGYSSSIYTIATASASETGHKTYYGEQCSSILTTTYSSGSGSAEHSVISSDVNNLCTTGHGGTSAAAPMLAGVLALLLQANPDLTWRDVQHIIVQTSRRDRLQTEPDANWRQNAAGHNFSDYFGFGLVDAEAMVNLANPETWINYPEKSVCTVEADEGYDARVIDTNQNLKLDIQTNACKGTSDEVKHLEHVVLYVTTEYSKRGALNIHLTSPSGTETVLLSERPVDSSSSPMTSFPLMSVQLWGEDPSFGDGNWRLEIFDSSHGSENSGSLLHWKLELHGTKSLPHQ